MIKFPFLNGQQLNLDWIMQKLREILNFMPIDQGSVGDVLQRGTKGATWQPLTSVVYDINGMSTAAEVTASDELPIYDVSAQGNYKVTVQDVLDLASASSVQSVNGQTGVVVLSIPADTSDLNNDSGFVDAAGAAAAAPVQSVNGQTGAVTISGGGAVDSVNGQTGTVVLTKSDVGLGNVANVAQYSASNPPPYPVTSVNGLTGDVIVSGGGGGMDATLLWTNSTPAASFATQTVSLDLSGYRFVLIEYTGRYFEMRTALLPCPQITPPAGYAASCDLQSFYSNGAAYCMANRWCEITTTGIEFGGGIRIDSYYSSNSSDDTVSRPTRIWGIA